MKDTYGNQNEIQPLKRKIMMNNSTPTVLVAFGTRPEWIKLQPVIQEFKKRKCNHQVLYVAQHEDIPGITYDHKIDIPPSECEGDRLNSIFRACMGPEVDFVKMTGVGDLYLSVMVQGDTATACAIAMAAGNQQLPVIHVEAGLRTFDHTPHPEEMYRKIITQIADVNFCPTEQERENIRHSTGISLVVGNTINDVLMSIENRGSLRLKKKDRQNKTDVLVTLHRRENMADLWPDKYADALGRLSLNRPNERFIFVRHPNKKYSETFERILRGRGNVVFVDPMSHEELLRTLVRCKYVISDSGGLQEEAAYFLVPIFVCRSCTERGHIISNTHVGCLSDHNTLERDIIERIDQGLMNLTHADRYIYGKGNTAKLIVDHLEKNEYTCRRTK